MKEITILSGKGGTGKTSLTAALVSVGAKMVVCDNDVDASDLHLLLNPEIIYSEPFKGAWLSEVDKAKCSSCGLCADYCRFDAISDTGFGFAVNPLECEGCRLCEHVCPENAIKSIQSLVNTWEISDTRFGKMVHATMQPGEENSGKLVATIRNEARILARESGAEFIINDGPPGIGCSTISSVTGCDLVVLVAEPTLSGEHDIKRLVSLVGSFGISMVAVINKYDINTEMSTKLKDFFTSEGIPLVERIAYSEDFTAAMIQGKTVCEYAPDSDICKRIKHIWQRVSQ